MMNHGKKLLSLLLALMLLLGMAQGVAFAAGTTVTLVPNATQPLNPGDSFTVTAQISGNTGYNAVGFCIDFDRDALELEGFDISRKYTMSALGAVTNKAKTTEAHPIPFGFITGAAASPETSDDDMFQMNFKVKTGAQAGSYTIRIDPTNGEHVFARVNTDQSVNTINASFVPASVTVAASQSTEPTIVPVSGISLNKKSLNLTVGGSDTLTATVTPDNATDKTVTWTSSSPSVASVVNGLVTAKAAGQATITAKAGSQTATATVKVSPAASGDSNDYAYIAVNGADTSVKAGDTVSFNVFINNDRNSSSIYNSYEFVLSYDTDRLSYTGVAAQGNDEKCAGTQSNGSITINGYGDDKTISADNSIVTVLFKVKDDAAVGDASVTLGKAYRSTSAQAINQDIDEISVASDAKTAAVTVEAEKPEHTVRFSSSVIIDGESKTSTTVIDGESVSFSVPAQTGSTASVTVDGIALTPDNGIYTIANVTKDITVTISYTANTYSVTVDGSGATDVTAATSATHGQAYSFTVNKNDGYNYTVSVKVGGSTVACTESGNSYTIAAANVTGDIAITVTKTAKTPTPTEYTVTIYKNGVSSSTAKATEGKAYSFTADAGFVVYKVVMNNQEIGVTNPVSISSVTGDIAIYMGQTYSVTLPDDNSVTGAASANYGSDYSFTLTDGYTVTVTVGGSTVTPNQSNGSYTIPGGQINGDIVITTQKISYTSSVEVYEYVKAKDGTLIQLIVAKPAAGGIVSGEILRYDGHDMFRSVMYGGYAYLVAVGQNETKLTSAAAAEKITKATAALTSISYNGDVNKTNAVDINDAQLVYDIYKGLYSDFTAVSMEKMLRADMNGSCSITVEDVAAVVAEVRK